MSDGEHVRLGAGRSPDTAKDWAERVAGLKPDRALCQEQANMA